MPSAGSTGTEVNRAVTSYGLRHSPGINVTLFAFSMKSWVLWMVGGFTYQWLKYFGKHFSHSIGNKSMAGHYRPGGVGLVDLGETKEFGGTTTHGVPGFICATNKIFLIYQIKIFKEFESSFGMADV